MTKILCIEDEAPLRRIITAELRDAGYETFEAENGREGIDAVLRHRPDLVLCDVNMPVMGGYEALSHLRSIDGDLADIPFIFLTALADRKDEIAGRGLGADDYLIKPVDMDLLLATVASRLERAQRVSRRLEEERRRLEMARQGVEAERRVFEAEREVIDAERRAAEERLRMLANHDPLTGLANHTHIGTLIEAAIAAAGPGEGPKLVLIDIDRFRTVAATLGRQCADDLLVVAAQRLASAIGPDAVVARPGEERFAALLPAGIPMPEAERLAEDIRRSMAEPYAVGGRNIYTTVTLGLAGHPDHAATAAELFARAEVAAHDALRQGGNLWRTYRPDMVARELERLTIEDALRSALENRELQLAYQPKVSMADGRPVGMEALLRWNSATMGWVSPALFIPVAEEAGLILPIGAFVLREACRQLRIWRDAGVASDLQVAVNVSAQQFRDPGFVAMVSATLEETGLPSSALALEITESSLVDDDALIATLRALRDIGVTLSIDDFGTGYSSLSYLGRLPAQELKIDQSFVRGLPDTAGSQGIVEAVIGIGLSLGLKLVAEGVETAPQLAFLRERGCHVAQGYLFSRPLPPADFESFVRKGMQQAVL